MVLFLTNKHLTLILVAERDSKSLAKKREKKEKKIQLSNVCIRNCLVDLFWVVSFNNQYYVINSVTARCVNIFTVENMIRM